MKQRIELKWRALHGRLSTNAFRQRVIDMLRLESSRNDDDFTKRLREMIEQDIGVDEIDRPLQ